MGLGFSLGQWPAPSDLETADGRCGLRQSLAGSNKGRDRNLELFAPARVGVATHALRHGRIVVLPWLALTYTAARLGFEAQNAAAFRLLRLAGGVSRAAANEIVPEAILPPAETTPTLSSHPMAVAPKRHHVVKKIHNKSAAVRKRGKRAKRG